MKDWSKDYKVELVCRAKDSGFEVVIVRKVFLGIEDQFGGY